MCLQPPSLFPARHAPVFFFSGLLLAPAAQESAVGSMLNNLWKKPKTDGDTASPDVEAGGDLFVLGGATTVMSAAADLNDPEGEGGATKDDNAADVVDGEKEAQRISPTPSSDAPGAGATSKGSKRSCCSPATWWTKLTTHSKVRPTPLLRHWSFTAFLFSRCTTGHTLLVVLVGWRDSLQEDKQLLVRLCLTWMLVFVCAAVIHLHPGRRRPGG